MNKKNNNKEICEVFTIKTKYEKINKSLEEAIQSLKEKNQKTKDITESIIKGELTDEEIEQVRKEFFNYKN